MPPKPRGKITRRRRKNYYTYIYYRGSTPLHLLNLLNRDSPRMHTYLQKNFTTYKPTKDGQHCVLQHQNKLTFSIIIEKEREEQRQSSGGLISFSTSTGEPIQLTKTPPSVNQKKPLLPAVVGILLTLCHLLTHVKM